MLLPYKNGQANFNCQFDARPNFPHPVVLRGPQICPSYQTSAESLHDDPRLNALLVFAGPVLGDSPFLSRSLVKPFAPRQFAVLARAAGTAASRRRYAYIDRATDKMNTRNNDRHVATIAYSAARQSMRPTRHGSGGPKMISPQHVFARECLDCALQRALRSRVAGTSPAEKSVPARKGRSDFKQAFRRFDSSKND